MWGMWLRPWGRSATKCFQPCRIKWKWTLVPIKSETEKTEINSRPLTIHSFVVLFLIYFLSKFIIKETQRYQRSLPPPSPIDSPTKYLLSAYAVPCSQCLGCIRNKAGKPVVFMASTFGCTEKSRHTALRRPDLSKDLKGCRPNNYLSTTTFVVRVFWKLLEFLCGYGSKFEHIHLCSRFLENKRQHILLYLALFNISWRFLSDKFLDQKFPCLFLYN